jgi:hypothetical protein
MNTNIEPSLYEPCKLGYLQVYVSREGGLTHRNESVEKRQREQWESYLEVQRLLTQIEGDE